MRATFVVPLFVAIPVLAGEPVIEGMGKSFDKGIENAQRQLDKEQEKVKALSAEEQKCTEMAMADVSFEDELALGGAVAVKLATTSPLLIEAKKGKTPPRDAPVNELVRYVNHVGKVMASVSPRSAIEWKFGILRNDQPNAWSAPGGFVFVTTGLLRKVRSEDQLAGVLAHEIAHVSLRHALSHYKAIKNAECKTIYVAKPAEQLQAGVKQAAASLDKSPVGAFLKSKNGPELSSAANVDVLKWAVDALIDVIVTRGQGHDLELAADKLATDMLIDTGYSVREFAAFLEGLPGFAFSTHPKGTDRRAAVVAHAKARMPDDFTPPPHLEPHPLGSAMQHLNSIK